MSDNNITIIGGVTREAELRYTNGGQPVAKFGVAVNRRWQKNGEWQEEVAFLDVSCWGSLAENCATSLEKGTRVIVNGRMSQRQYEAKDGTMKNAYEVVADSVGVDLRWATAVVEKVGRTTAIGTAPATPDSGEEPF